ncbi:unnamed protein product [Bursaphelenchus xylophilus]|uniref:Nicotinamide-nucleotide adenylyltransferase n=1 Tax=Bursaphelenchus xylophilus TaxID=6326 RepID=A0A1I7SAG5_BURXY|nr:unnamed protein product [Bursaphelenchus xylophilus]CAG9083919.1 unnamed protein product [Bursaphelenchus xylophilus]
MIPTRWNGAKVALLACGSFNPPTFMHLRMFERARDLLQQEYKCTVVEGIISPVGDRYGKSELISSSHRLRMCELAVRSSEWIRADGWECSQTSWTRTRVVLEHHRSVLQAKHGTDIQLILLCGEDFVDSFAVVLASGENLWKSEDLSHIFTQYGVVCLQRVGGDARKTLEGLAVPKEHVSNVIFVQDETFPNSLSSTRLRNAIRNGLSIRYCSVDEVVEYVKEFSLYK